MTHVAVRPEMLQWARERADLEIDALLLRFPRLEEWENEKAQPTLRQLERFANATMAPIGFFFLKSPPEETIPIPDFRTMENRGVTRPSPNLLDTIYVCQQRQEWYRESARVSGEAPVPFVGSVTLRDPVEAVAERMRRDLKFSLADRRDCPTWTEALKQFVALADAAGVLVMCTSIVMNNTRRRLSPEEFRGFAMVDPIAPLVFVNSSDSRSAQMFTLAHELAHVWLGETALSDSGPRQLPTNQVEIWCNRVAAEFLVPMSALRGDFREDAPLVEEVERLAKVFKVSTLVILRRVFDAGYLTRSDYQTAYDDELDRLSQISGWGRRRFHLTLAARVSTRFARTLVYSTYEGRTSFTEAFRLLGVKKLSTFQDLGISFGLHCK